MIPSPAPLAAVLPLLEEGERVCLVLGSGRPPAVATSRRLFLVWARGVDAHRLVDLIGVEREDEGHVIVLRPGRPRLLLPVDPVDEAGLQALTVLALLAAAARRGHDLEAEGLC
jgi:hypothetical protein